MHCFFFLLVSNLFRFLSVGLQTPEFVHFPRLKKWKSLRIKLNLQKLKKFRNQNVNIVYINSSEVVNFFVHFHTITVYKFTVCQSGCHLHFIFLLQDSTFLHTKSSVDGWLSQSLVLVESAITHWRIKMDRTKDGSVRTSLLAWGANTVYWQFDTIWTVSFVFTSKYRRRPLLMNRFSIIRFTSSERNL